MDRYLVKVRFFGEEHDIREFIQPWSAPVAEIAERLPEDKDQAILGAWEYIHRHVSYPLVEPSDYRYQEAFLRSAGGVKVFEPRVALMSETLYDYFQLPAETVAAGVGDCEDTAGLLTSILRNRLSAEEIFATIGTWQGFGHAWVTVAKNGKLYTVETTKAAAKPLKTEAAPYIPYIRFNDQVFIEIRPGLLYGTKPRYYVAVDKLGLNKHVRKKYALLTG